MVTSCDVMRLFYMNHVAGPEHTIIPYLQFLQPELSVTICVQTTKFELEGNVSLVNQSIKQFTSDRQFFISKTQFALPKKVWQPCDLASIFHINATLQKVSPSPIFWLIILQTGNTLPVFWRQAFLVCNPNISASDNLLAFLGLFSKIKVAALKYRQWWTYISYPSILYGHLQKWSFTQFLMMSQKCLCFIGF